MNYDIDAVARITAVHDDPRPHGHSVCRECGYGWPCEKYLLAQDVIEARAAIDRVRALCDAHEYGARDWDIAVVPTSLLRAAVDGEE